MDQNPLGFFFLLNDWKYSPKTSYCTLIEYMIWPIQTTKYVNINLYRETKTTMTTDPAIWGGSTKTKQKIHTYRNSVRKCVYVYWSWHSSYKRDNRRPKIDWILIPLKLSEMYQTLNVTWIRTLGKYTMCGARRNTQHEKISVCTHI